MKPLKHLMMAAILTGCSGGPTTLTSTTPFEDLRNGAATDYPSPGRIYGRVVDTLTGAPITDVHVEIPGIATTKTGPDGAFSFHLEGTGRVSCCTEGRDHWRRETYIQVNPATSVELDLLPNRNGFDLRFFDHVFRDRGRSSTHPWSEEPLFEIWVQSYACTRKSASGACEELEAMDSRAPQSHLELAQSVIENDTRLYTGGRLRGSNVIEHQHDSGTRVPISRFLRPGKVTIAFVDRGDDASWALWQYYAEGEMYAGHIQINMRHRTDRGVYSHELAHILGFDHPEGLDAVPSRSIMRRGHGSGPTPVDILHGRVLYERPAGSRTPDKDPENFTLNTLTRLGMPRGGLVTTIRQ